MFTLTKTQRRAPIEASDVLRTHERHAEEDALKNARTALTEPRSSGPSVVAVTRELADLVARRVSIDDFAERMGMREADARSLEAEIVNAVLTRRMTSIDGRRTARVPTSGLDVFARSSVVDLGTTRVVEIGVTVTNELPVPLLGVTLECASFNNSSMAALSLGGSLRPLEPSERDAGVLMPGASIEYHARYVPTPEDHLDDALLICSFISRGASEAGEWAVGQGDAWIELDESAAALRPRS